MTYTCPELWNDKIAYSHDIASLPHTSRMTMNAMMISLPLVE
jgi:hypothetical protein